MSRNDREPTRIVRAWLEEGVTALPDRVLDAVEAQLPSTPQRRAGWLARRFTFMNDPKVRYGLGAVAAIVLALAGWRFLPGTVGGPQATPSPNPSSSIRSSEPPPSSSSAPTAGLASNGKIIVADGTALRTFNPDGSGMAVLATIEGKAVSVTVSPDGRSVAYVVETDHDTVRVTDIATGGSTDVQVPTLVGGEPVSWSPDSQSITFAGADAEGNWHVYVAAADGSSLQTVPLDGLDSRLDIVTPVWSPNGDWIAFVATPRGIDSGQVYLVRPDGSDLQALEGVRATVGDAGYLSFAPDPGVQRLLYVAPPQDGEHGVHLYDVARGSDYDTGLAFWPAWSPDGTEISACCATIVKTADVIAGTPQPRTVFAQWPEGNCADAADYSGRGICWTATWSPDGTMLISVDVTESAMVMAPADGSGSPVVLDLETAKNFEIHWAWQPVPR